MATQYDKKRQANYKFIETELYCYHETKKDLERMRDEIINGSCFPEVSVQTEPANITQTKAIKLCSTPLILESERRLRVLDSVLEALKQKCSDQYKYIELRFFRNMTDTAISETLHIGERHLRRWRLDVIKLIAERMGLEV
jgi:RinA family phage transcriptional activator